jgi:hypothetical protein
MEWCQIWSRVGPTAAAIQRPLQSNGDIPMLAFAEQPDRPCLRLADVGLPRGLELIAQPLASLGDRVGGRQLEAAA